jgi:hypothetical protein
MSYLGLGFVMSVFIQYSADAASAQTIPAKLICGAHSSNPEKLREFQANVVFTLSGGNLIGKRALTSNGGGEETFKGTVSPAGAILVSGEGHYKRGGAWVYELTGIRNDAGDTTLSGKLTNTSGSIGERTCQIIFLKPRTL